MRWAIFGVILAGAVAFWFWERNHPDAYRPEQPDPIDREAAEAALTPLVLSGSVLWADPETASVAVHEAFLEAPDAKQRELLGPAYRSLRQPIGIYTADGARVGTFGSRGLLLDAERHPPESAGDPHVHRVETPAGASP